MKKRPSPRTSVRGDGLPASLRQCRQLKRQASLHRHCEAGAPTGCGNPLSPSKPPSLVQKWGIQWGRSPLGRRGGSLPSFAALRKKVAPAGAKYPSSCSRPRRSGLTSSLLRIRRLRLLFTPSSRRLRRADFFAAKEIGERNRQREPIPKAVPFGILPHRPGGCGPLEIPRGSQGTRDGGRETEGERRKTKDERRWTGDEGRELGREERIATPASRVRNDGGWGGPPFALPCCQEME